MAPEEIADQPLAGQRVVVTGANGQLGTYLRSAVEAAGGRPIAFGTRPEAELDQLVDITDRRVVREALREARPDAVIHAAAYTDVDGCERDPDRAFAVNAAGARNVAEGALAAGSYLVGVGTDFVFPGNGGAPYAEDAPVRPISVYGQSKLEGEQAIVENDPAFAVARTAWVFGGAGKHFPRTVLNVLQSRPGMEVVDDEKGNPTFAADLAEALVRLVALRGRGIFHLTNSGSATRFALARRVAAAAGLDPARIAPTTTEAFLAKYPLPAKRPPDSRLQNNRAQAMGIVLRSWDEAVDAYVPRLAAELAAVTRP